MSQSKLFLFCFCFGIASFSFAQQPFKTGDVVVVRLGDGITDYAGRSAPMFLDEYSPTGTFIQSVPLPVSDNGSNFKISHNFNNPSLAMITHSPDRRFITLFGYTTDPGTTIPSLAVSSVSKTIARVDYNASINSSTTVPGINGVEPVASVTNDGSSFWSIHINSGGGLVYSTLGQSTAVSIADVSNLRIPSIYENQLYATISSGRVQSVSGGLPTTGPQTFSILPGLPLVSGMTQVFFADLDQSIPGFDVIYMANIGGGAFRKFSLVGGTWVSNGIIGDASSDYCSIDGSVNAGSVTLFCTRKVRSNDSAIPSGELVTLTDNSGYNGAFSGTPTLLATAGALMQFGGSVIVPAPLSVSLSTKVFLQGAYNSGIGRHKNVTTAWANVLNTSALSQPYNVAPFNYAGTENVSAGFFTADDGVDTDILDWVLLELHDATTPSTIIARKACFIREDGKIVDLDKVSNPTFTGVGANDYYIVVKHRNHLPIRSATTVFVNGSTPITYDFTTAQSQAYQNPAITSNAAMKDVSGVFCMWGGNVNANNNTKYTGPQNDALALLAQLSANQAAIVQLPGGDPYKGGDVNMDGVIRYTGPNNDALALLAVLSANQAAVINEHQ